MSTPFTPTGKVRPTAWQVGVDHAVAAARAAGFRPTPRSTISRVYVQRDWKTAATIRPTPSGVVVRPAWTTPLTIIVAVVLALLVTAVCVCPGLLAIGV